MSVKEFKPTLHKEETEVELYKIVIVILLLGIILFSVVLFFIKQQPETFSGLAFTKGSVIPDFIVPGSVVSFNLTITNQGDEDITYPLEITANENEITRTLYSNAFSVPKNQEINITLNFSIDDFNKSEIITSSEKDKRKLNFFVYNPNTIMKYPDGIAYKPCVKTVSATPQQNFIIRVKGKDNPSMKIRLDGKPFLSRIINNTKYENLNLKANINWSYMDIIFDNDYSNKTQNIDRNLIIEYIQMGNVTITPKDMTLDSGRGNKAFDCSDLKNDTNLYSNGALRVRLSKN